MLRAAAGGNAFTELRGGETMRLKESILLAMKLARKEKQVLVVGREEKRWLIVPLEDPSSDQLAESFIITPTGLRYPDDEMRLAELVARGE